MKKGIWSLGMIVLTGLMLLVVGALTAAEKKEPPEEVKIENAGYKTDKKGHVKLSHKIHTDKKENKGYGVTCVECHHEYDKDKKNVWTKDQPVKKCAECHNPLKTVKEGKTKIYKLNLAYHKNCKNCHKALLAEGKSEKAPFKKCNDCHQKKAK